jgi:hypothetical protein
MCPLTDEWVKKLWYIYAIKHYSALQKNETLPFAATQMPVDDLMLSEVRQVQKEKYTVRSHLHVETKKKKKLSA